LGVCNENSSAVRLIIAIFCRIHAQSAERSIKEDKNKVERRVLCRHYQSRRAYGVNCLSRDVFRLEFVLTDKIQ